jgi:two-component system chemotaxis response regulator CheB
MPVIVISSLAQSSCQTAMQALSLGAVEVLAKPGGPYSVGELRLELAAKIRAAAAAHVRPAAASKPAAPAAPPPRLAAGEWTPSTVIAIGASTGGTEAIADVLPRLPQDVPGIVITQHIPAGFSRAFAIRLNQMCAFEVKEAEDGDILAPGRALVAPGDFHMLLRKCGGGYRVTVKTGPRVCYQRPSVDVMFSSVAESAGARAVGVLLTGMGSDGAQGLLKMRDAGAQTIAQDEATCVVFGMPREAIRAGAAGRVVALPGIPLAILAAIAPGR